YTGPVFCALLAWLLQRRRISPRTWLAIVIAMIGILVMVFGSKFPQGWVGPMCGVLSGIAFGALILVLEKLNRSRAGGVNPFAIVAFNNLGCAVLLLPISASLHANLIAKPWQLGMVIACGVVQLGVPYVIFQL